MPLEILLVLVVGGIAGITVLLHLTGKSRLHVLTPDTAPRQWLRHFPEDTVIDVTIAHDGHAALVRTQNGAGLIWSFGADTVARHLQDYDWFETANGIEVRFHDFSTPRATLHLDQTERQHWQHLMRPA